MSPAIAPYVSAISVMLGAYGFFYNAYKQHIDAGFDVEGDAANSAQRRKDRAAVQRARNAARVLAVIPLLVFVLLLDQVEDNVAAAIDDFSWDAYSTLDVIFVVLACAWLAIGLVVGDQARRLGRKLKQLPA